MNTAAHTAALTKLTAEERRGERAVDRPMAKLIAAAIEQAGIRPSQKRRQGGDLQDGDQFAAVRWRCCPCVALSRQNLLRGGLLESQKPPYYQGFLPKPSSGFEPLTPSLRVSRGGVPARRAPRTGSCSVRSWPGFPPQSAKL